MTTINTNLSMKQRKNLKLTLQINAQFSSQESILPVNFLLIQLEHSVSVSLSHATPDFEKVKVIIFDLLLMN